MTYKEFIAFCSTKSLSHNIEIHHIEPLSIGGVDISKNRIALSTKDHYNAHKLLAIEHPYNLKLWQAWWQVYNTHKDCQKQKDYILIRKFLLDLPFSHSEESRRRKSIATTKQMHSMTSEQKKLYAEKISKANKKAYQNPEARKRVSDGLKKKWQDENYRDKMRQIFKGIPKPKHTDDFREKMSEIQKGKKWFTNGRNNVFGFVCPEGYRPGMTRGIRKVNV